MVLFLSEVLHAFKAINQDH